MRIFLKPGLDFTKKLKSKTTLKTRNTVIQLAETYHMTNLSSDPGIKFLIEIQPRSLFERTFLKHLSEFSFHSCSPLIIVNFFFQFLISLSFRHIRMLEIRNKEETAMAQAAKQEETSETTSERQPLLT